MAGILFFGAFDFSNGGDGFVGCDEAEAAADFESGGVDEADESEAGDKEAAMAAGKSLKDRSLATMGAVLMRIKVMSILIRQPPSKSGIA